MAQVLMQANAGELKSADIKEFIESLGVKNYFSLAYEQHQNGLAEPSINSIMLLNRTQMVAWSMLKMKQMYFIMNGSRQPSITLYMETRRVCPNFRHLVARR